MLTVTAPAQDRSLLTIAELRGAVGQPDNGQDAALQTLGDRIASMIATYCCLSSDGINPPTFRRESVRESYRLGYQVPKLILARVPVVQITSVTDNGASLASEDYEFQARSGLLFRLLSDQPVCWSGRVIVTYEAGYAIVPDDLKLAAARLAKVLWTSQTRDPLIRRQEVPGVLNTEYWVGGFGDGNAWPPEVTELLQPYRQRMA